MEINTEIRQKQLENLDQFISASNRQLDAIFATLGWAKQKVKDDDNLLTCPQDANHRVHARGFEEHLRKCTLNKLGYNDEPFLSEPLNHPTASTTIDNQQKLKIFSKIESRSGYNGTEPDPMTSSRLLATFSPAERLAMYKYVKSCTVGPDKLPEFNLTQITPDNKELTYEERLEQERNAKRRRIKYKSVHTSHKNHTEVLRDVIKNQMESYSDWVQEKLDPANTNEESNCSLEKAHSIASGYSGNSIRESHKRHRSEHRSEKHERARETSICSVDSRKSRESSRCSRDYAKRKSDHGDRRSENKDGREKRRRDGYRRDYDYEERKRYKSSRHDKYR